MNRRRENHAEAASEPFEPTAAPAHALIPTQPPLFIQDQSSLDEFIEHVRQCGICCYDTEFIGESFYFPRLCLVQIATPQRIAVIDALATVDLKCVWELLSDDRVEKVVHAGMQDLEPMVRGFGQPPANVFDTQLASGFVALPYPISLSRLTQELLDVRIGKKLTFTCWDHRPLSEAHVHYAADDVRFGLAIQQALIHRLTANGNLEFARAECAGLCTLEYYQSDLVEVSMRMRGMRNLKRSRQAVLHELIVLRDELARFHDLPSRTLIRDDVVMEIARRSPSSAAELDAIRGLPRPVKADFGHRILEAITIALQRKAPPWADLEDQEERPREQFLVEGLWERVRLNCREHGIDPGLATNRKEVADAYRALRSGNPLPGRLGEGWRGRIVGSVIEAFVGEAHGHTPPAETQRSPA